MASRKDSMMKTARKEESGYTSCHMSSGAQDSAVQSHRTNTVLPCLRLRSYLNGMWKSQRVEMYIEGEADEARQLELDSIEEARWTALVQSARYL
jgi:hypothetical protein